MEQLLINNEICRFFVIRNKSNNVFVVFHRVSFTDLQLIYSHKLVFCFLRYIISK